MLSSIRHSSGLVSAGSWWEDGGLGYAVIMDAMVLHTTPHVAMQNSHRGPCKTSTAAASWGVTLCADAHMVCWPSVQPYSQYSSITITMRKVQLPRRARSCKFLTVPAGSWLLTRQAGPSPGTAAASGAGSAAT